MRQLFVQVPRGHGGEVMELARAHEATNSVWLEAQGAEEDVDLVLLYLPNGKVEGFVGDLERFPQPHVTLIPRGVLPLAPPASEAPAQVRDVQVRSPLEVFLGGLQSVGSWRGFLSYAVAAGVVVWIGLFTSTSYLLVAAMLLAPFAGPAMNVAMATSRGDTSLLRRGLLRYAASIAVTVGVAGLLSVLLQQQVATPQMVAQSRLSAVAVLLPLVAGAAGALNLVQSERSSLVSGAATGMLVAASLAPPAGLVGMASAIGEWSMALSGLFVLALQLVGINLSGALVFRAFGLSPRGARYERGRALVFPVTLAVTTLLLGGLLWVQFSGAPSLQRSSREQRAVAQIQNVVEASGLAQLVASEVRFTRANIEGQNTLLSTLYVQRRAGVALSDEELSRRLTEAVQTRLLQAGFNVTPLVEVTVLEPPTE